MPYSIPENGMLNSVPSKLFALDLAINHALSKISYMEIKILELNINDVSKVNKYLSKSFIL